MWLTVVCREPGLLIAASRSRRLGSTRVTRAGEHGGERRHVREEPRTGPGRGERGLYQAGARPSATRPSSGSGGKIIRLLRGKTARGARGLSVSVAALAPRCALRRLR